jgi:hypothetical protein
MLAVFPQLSAVHHSRFVALRKHHLKVRIAPVLYMLRDLSLKYQL